MGTDAAPGVSGTDSAAGSGGASAGAPRAGTTIRVTVRYLSAVREKTSRRLDELDLPSGSQLSAVAEWLKASYGLAVPGPSLMSTINGYGWNQVPQGMATELHEGDEIALFPLLSGG